MITKHGKPIMFRGFFFHVQSAITIGAGDIGAPIVLAYYKEDDCVPRLLIELYKQETEIC
jgi:hypothetical protein